jgi:hypothetical protein
MATIDTPMMPPPPQEAATVPDMATPGPASAHTGFVKKVKFILKRTKQNVKGVINMEG